MNYPAKIIRFFGTSIFILAFAIFTNAQVSTADVNGTVSDSAGRVVAGATVTIANPATGFSRTATTDGAGYYVITSLQPGDYTLTVEAASFSKTVVKDLALRVGLTRTVNVELKAGQITEVVEVIGNEALVETTKSDIGTGISPKEIENLPLLNRTFAGLSVIAPEARPVGNFDPTKTRVGNVAFNGGDGRQVNVNVDGGDNKDNVVGSLLQNFSYESIQEFQVIQHRWTAEQGRSVGGIVNVITKSGTNEFHGSFFANFRDESLRAFDFFEKQRQVATPSFVKPSFSRQEIGGSLGGPIVKEKLFFFFALEKFRERQNNAVTAVAAREIPLIPGSQFVSEIPTPYNDLLLSAKVDHKLTSKQSMFYRFSYQKNDSPNDQIGVPGNADLSGGNTDDNKLYSFLVNHTYAATPNTLNNFTFHFQDFLNEILGVSDKPLLQFPGVSIGQNPNVPQATLERKYQFRDDVTWITGGHTLKFGTNYINTELGGFFFFGARGYALTFNALPSVLLTRPQGFATPGNVSALTFSDGAGNHDQKIGQLAFYVQDDWKVTRNLTLNLGLRWDANIGNLPDQTNNRTIRILSLLNEPRARAITGDAEKLSRTTPSYKEFQPRIGFAYDPTGNGKTVIRGGYGIFYDQLFQNLTLFSLIQSNPELFQTVEPLNATQLAAFRFGVDPLPPVPNFSLSELAVGSTGRINDPDATEPYVQKFTIGFQHELSPRFSISSDYVHTLGVREPRYININPLIRTTCDPVYGGNPANARCGTRGAAARYFDRAFLDAGLPVNRLNQINMFSTTNRSLFDSWTTTIKYRSRKFLLNGAYVLASSRSWGGQPTASYSGNGIAIALENQFKEGEFGPTRLDERHRVVLSGVFELPYGFQLSPIMQLASSRPFSAATGVDIDGDGLQTIDRLCQGVSPLTVLQSVRAGNSPFVTNSRNCQQASVNSLRSGFIETSPGNFEERSGRFFNVDLRVTKNFKFGERFKLSTYADFYNLFNTTNLSLASRIGLTAATASGTNAQPGTFLLPVSLYGPGFGPPVGRPFTAQLGARFTF